MEVKTVTVVGATGTMGANVAGIFASFGNAKVFMVGRDIEKVKKIIPKTVKSVRADSISVNLIPADFSMLDDCVKQSDLVFESAIEDISVKKDVAKKIASNLSKTSISCTGSSGLSITEIAECYPMELRRNFFGVHLFNPPYNMSLCELTSTKYSNQTLKEELSNYLKNKLYRTVVEVKDSPAFLANRIGFQFINEALQYAEKYKDNGGIDYIDSIIGPFTGRSMAPIVTSDFVGLDVHKAIVDNVYTNLSDYAKATFILPEYVKKLIEKGNLGRKSGCGLYQTIKYENGLKRYTVYDIETDSYRDKINYVFPFADEMKKRIRIGNYVSAFKHLVNNHSQEAEICKHFLVNYIVYSLYLTKEVGFSIESADDVMATGFNWCPPLALIQAFSTVINFNDLVKQYIDPEILDKIQFEKISKEIIPSKYDYRIYFKVGK